MRLARVLCENGGELCLVGCDVERLLVREDDEAGLAAGRLLDVADLCVVDGNLRRAAGLAEVGGEAGGEQDVLFARLCAAILQHDVGARDVLRVEPRVVVACRLERQLVVLVVVLADEDVCAVRRAEVEGAGGLVVILLLGLLAQVARGNELVVDLGDLGEARGGEQGCLDALEVGDVRLALAALDLQEFLRVVSAKEIII